MKINPYNFSLIGRRIKQARQAKRYTQAELAEIIDMSSKNVSQLERGMTGVSVISLIKICKALEISADYILFGIEDKMSDSTVNKLFSILSEREQIYAEKLISVYVDFCKNR